MQVIANAKGKQDLVKIRKEFGRYIHQAQNTAWVACFSEDVNSNLMWSHYADYHKGFVLEYDFSSCKINEVQSENLFPVLYSDEPYNAKDVISWFVLRDSGTVMPFPDVNYWVKAVFLRLRNGHMRENGAFSNSERTILPLFESFELIPSAIYYGYRMSSADYNILYTIVKSPDIKEYKMRPVKGYKTYDMEAVAI